MEISTTTQNGVTVTSFSGSLDGGTVSDAQDKIMPLISSKISMVLDLKECKYVSSAGLRLLLLAAKQLSTQGGVLVLSGLSDEVKDVMEMTGFSNFFKMFDCVASAVEALAKEG
ncbi:MAG TPA: STAS domain-containing protein [Candidatus Omnitrophota bacterium]|jgi:anti-anti-sigma factor|nr:STAS domain-containing protein [Candidatus Omnitrophota bacterium]HRZ15420.1 STAS domain-containing protein [Candidatus Omnitrophota bacterium]